MELADIERLSVGADSLGPHLVDHPSVRGAVVLATCNRLELYLDADLAASSEDDVLDHARATLAATSGVHIADVVATTRSFGRGDAIAHLIEVTCGLDSMVVGEREITGQVRRAHRAATEQGTSTGMLETAVRHALRAARRIAVDTDLARAGRSIVAVALDLAGAALERPGCRRTREQWDGATIAVPAAAWSGARALLLGTGAYAGASLTALRARGCCDVAVWSASGRAPAFADSHGCDALAPTDAALEDALVGADLVVSCRGRGTTTLDAALVRRAVERRATERGADVPSLAILDLALSPDVERTVHDLPGVVLVNLEAVRAHSPAAVIGEVGRAQRIVADAVAELTAHTAGRAMDGVVVALRTEVGVALERELTRLPQSGTVDAQDAAHALRRLAATLLHQPTVNAREAGRAGQGAEFVDALATVLGVDYSHLLPGDAHAAGAPILAEDRTR